VILELYQNRFRRLSNYRDWQVIVRRESVKLGGNLEDIINFAEVQRISIYMHSVDIWFYDKASKTGIGLELFSMQNIFHVV
jgi:hypothetical protein